MCMVHSDRAGAGGDDGLVTGADGGDELPAGVRGGLADEDGALAVVVADAQAVVGETPRHVLAVRRRHQHLVLLHRQDRLLRVQNLADGTLHLYNNIHVQYL